MGDAREIAIGILSADLLGVLEKAGLVVVGREELELQQNGLHDDNGQIAFTDLEPAMEMIQYAEEAIRDYGWMQVEIIRTKATLQDAGDGMVGASGDPNAFIRAQYKNSDKTFAEVAQRDRQWKRVKRLEERCKAFDKAKSAITDEQELALLDYLIEGEKMKEIGQYLGISRQRAHEIKNSMIRKLAWALQSEGK